VGSGMGPDTLAPVFFAVSTILAADWSRAEWSKAFSLILIFCFAIKFTSLKSHVFVYAQPGLIYTHPGVLKFFLNKCIQNQSRPILDVDILLGNFPETSGNLPYHRLLAATLLFYYNKQKLSIPI
jgi:hypothetical protein